MKKFIIYLFCANLVFGQSKILTLRQSIELGLKNSSEIKIAESKLLEISAIKDEVSAQMLPKLSLGASYTHLSDVPPFEVSIPNMPAPIKIQDVVLNSYAVQVSVEQPLFTGFRLSSLKDAAEKNKCALSIDKEKVINDKSFEIQTAFWNYYKAGKVVDLLEQRLSSTGNHIENTKQFLANDLVTKNDLLKLEVEEAKAKVSLIDAKNNLKLARMLFNKAIGLELDNETEIKVDEIDKVEVAGYENISGEAKTNRPEILTFQEQLKASENRIDAAKADYYPQLFAFGNFYYMRPNNRILPTKDEFNDTWDMGVRLKWNLWDWGNTGAKAEQAEQQKQQLENNLLLVVKSIQLEAQRNYENYLAGKEKVEVNKLVVNSAEESLRITNNKYAQQLATSAELIDAEVELFNAKTNLVISEVDFAVSKITLDKSIGKKIY